MKKAKYTKEEILEFGVKFIEKHQCYPSIDKWTISTAGCSKNQVSFWFKPWPKFVEELQKICFVPGVPKYWDADSILACIHESAKNNEGYPNRADFKNNKDYPVIGTIEKHLVSWNAALKTAGYEVHEKALVEDKEDAIQLGITYINKTNEYPYPKKWDIKSAGCSRDIIYDLFDNSWDNFIQELSKRCEIPDTNIDIKVKLNRAKWSKELIIDKIHEYYKTYNIVPILSEFTSIEDNPPNWIIKYYFTNWGNAVREAGYVLRKGSNNKKTENIEYTDIENLGSISEIIPQLLSLYTYEVPKEYTEEDVSLLLLLGATKANWPSHIAIKFMKQFDFYKESGNTYGSRILFKHGLKECTGCSLVYSLEDFYKSSSTCKKCALTYGVDQRHRRRIREKNATLGGINREEVKKFIKNRPKGMHVDHIIPLQGKYICGLNVISNLQYLPAKENIDKNNYHISEEYWKDEKTFTDGPKIQFEFVRFWTNTGE